MNANILDVFNDAGLEIMSPKQSQDQLPVSQARLSTGSIRIVLEALAKQ